MPVGDKPLVVFTVFFGRLPPWLPLTLQSMAANARVSFVVIGDAPPPRVIPPNVAFETISFGQMQQRLSELLTPGNGSSVRYDAHYKANDIKPLAADLYPRRVAGYEWWAWADLDVVFGDLLGHMQLASARPACCKVPLRPDGTPKHARAVNVYLHKGACPCERGERVNVICPLYPNPWRKKAWGPLTMFRTGALAASAAGPAEGSASAARARGRGRRLGGSAGAPPAAVASAGSAGERSPAGTALYATSSHWRSILLSADYAHFDEWWGPYHYSRGWETMGDVLTRMAEVDGSVIMSKAKLPFAEAKSCRDVSCMFCPCGALRMALSVTSAGGVPKPRLVVNGVEVMLLHLAESKFAWMHAGAAGGEASLPAWTPAYPRCYEVRGLGRMNASCGETCTSKAPIFDQFDVHGAVRPPAPSNARSPPPPLRSAPARPRPTARARRARRCTPPRSSPATASRASGGGTSSTPHR